MDIEVEIPVRYLITAGVATLLVFFGVLGYLVTPVEAGEAQVLTPARWHAMRLARQAAKEAEALTRDARDLRTMLERGRPSPVDAMLLAERIYAHHRQGTVATAAAREALITAAEVTARYAAGTASRAEAELAARRAFALIEGLREQERPRDVRHMLPYLGVNTP